MVQKLTAQKEETAPPKLSRVLRNSLLAGAIAISGCAASVGAPTTPPARSCPAPPKPLEIQCNGKLNYVGQWEVIMIGLTDRAAYKFIITGIEGNSVSADVMVPMLVSDGPALASLSFRFNEVRFSRGSITNVTEYLCAEIDEDQRERPRPQIAPRDDKSVFASAIVPIFPVADIKASDIGVLLKEILNSGAVGRALAHVALLGSGRMGEGSEAAKFSVSRTSEREYLIKIDKGHFAGREFRLDRRLDYGVDVIGPEPGFVSIPMRIEKLSTEKESYLLQLGVDCSRDIEISTDSASYSGPNPSCKK